MALHGGISPSPFPQPSSAVGRLYACIYKSLLIIIIVYIYLNVTTIYQRAGGCLGALIFVFIETFWTTITHEDSKTGKISVRGWQGSLGHSTFA